MPEAVPQLGGEHRLAHARRSRDQDDHRPLGTAQGAQQVVAARELLPGLLVHEPAHEGAHPLRAHLGDPQSPQLVLGAPRQAMRQLGIEADGQERLREHPARERQPGRAPLLDDHQLGGERERRLVTRPDVAPVPGLERGRHALVQLALRHLAAAVGAQPKLHLAHDPVRLLEGEPELLERRGQAAAREGVAPPFGADDLEPDERRGLATERLAGLHPGFGGGGPGQARHQVRERHALLAALPVVLLDVERDPHGRIGRDAGRLQRLHERPEAERVPTLAVDDAQLTPLHAAASRRVSRSSRSWTTFPVRPHTSCAPIR